MDGTRSLWACMQVLVLLNLVFVQLTGAAGIGWLAPLYVLALASPLLLAGRERLTYRMAWNAAVVGFFCVLLWHAWRADLATVLEDGLVLAVLCQVHLLNNLRSEQRPDLLFFNAFLIAIIAGYLNRGLGFPIAFLAFAPAFVVGLQLLVATRDGERISSAETRPIVLDGARRSLVLLALSLLVFFFWPRDFQRKAFLHGRLELTSGGPASFEVGFNEELVLGRRGGVGTSDREVLVVRLLEGDPARVPALWRGATLGRTTGDAWHPLAPTGQRSEPRFRERWDPTPGGLTRRVAGERGASVPAADGELRLAVERAPEETGRLFAPLEARTLALRGDTVVHGLGSRFDGTLSSAETGQLTYELRLSPAHPASRGGRTPAGVPAALAPYVALPEHRAVERTRALAERVLAAGDPAAQQWERVEMLAEHLARSFAYLPPGDPDAPDGLVGFLDGDGGGHCEFFASALATMLRTQGIPCRVVTGLRSDRWDDQGRSLRFRARDAHAWVEVFDPRAGWYAVDPSPRATARDAHPGLWARLRERARALWSRVIGFDAERRAALVAGLRGLPAKALGALDARPWAALPPALGIAGLLFLRRRRRRVRQHAAVRRYLRAWGRTRLAARPGETPRERLERARGAGLTAESLAQLERATAEHERARYAQRAPA